MKAKKLLEEKFPQELLGSIFWQSWPKLCPKLRNLRKIVKGTFYKNDRSQSKPEMAADAGCHDRHGV